MQKKVRRKLKKEVKIGLLCIGCLILAYNIYISNQRKEIDRRVEEYKECILKQSQEQGWIIRSYCSSDWRVMDELSKLKYKVIGYDVYLKEED